RQPLPHYASSHLSRAPICPSILLSRYLYSHPRDLHSFPTRRSSDLTQVLIASAHIVNDANDCWCNHMRLINNNARKLSAHAHMIDRKSTRLNSSHVSISYAVFCLKKKNSTAATHRPIKETI